MGSTMTRVTVGDIVRAVSKEFPIERAEDWDQIGLLAGDPEAVVTGVVLALDPSPSAVREARRLGANVLVTHHPAYLKRVAPVARSSGGGDIVFQAVSAGVALICAHTNLDRDVAAQTLLPSLLGLTPLQAIERSGQPASVVTVYAPTDCADSVVEAMSAAGGGLVGRYRGCAFMSPGEARFTPDHNALPHIGSPGVETTADEVRIEMSAARHLAERVAEAARAAHPYEEPLITITQVLRARNAAALGMLCVAETAMSLSELVSRATSALGITPRVWGDPALSVGSVACATGSAGSLIDAALAADATVLIAGEVRYHDATDALNRGLAVIEVGHDVSEWPLVGLLARVVREIPGIEPESIHEMRASTAWWTP